MDCVRREWRQASPVGNHEKCNLRMNSPPRKRGTPTRYLECGRSFWFIEQDPAKGRCGSPYVVCYGGQDCPLKFECYCSRVETLDNFPFKGTI
jgi:hypothetical protein